MTSPHSPRRAAARPAWLYDFALADSVRYAQVTREPAAGSGPRARKAQIAILDAAWELFQRGDFDAVTMDELAQEAGISRPSVYTYYHSKRSIFLAIAVAVNARFQANVSAFDRIQSGPRLTQELRAWVSDHLSFLEETFWTHQLWDSLAATDDRLRREGLHEESRAWRSLGTHLAELRGDRDDANAVMDGMLVLSMLERTWFYWCLAEGPVPRNHLANRATTAIGAMINCTGHERRSETAAELR